MSVPPDACLSAAPVSLRWMLAFQVACVLSVTVACSGLAGQYLKVLGTLPRADTVHPRYHMHPHRGGLSAFGVPVEDFVEVSVGEDAWGGLDGPTVVSCIAPDSHFIHPLTHPPTLWRSQSRSGGPCRCHHHTHRRCPSLAFALHQHFRLSLTIFFEPFSIFSSSGPPPLNRITTVFTELTTYARSFSLRTSVFLSLSHTHLSLFPRTAVSRPPHCESRPSSPSLHLVPSAPTASAPLPTIVRLLRPPVLPFPFSADALSLIGQADLLRSPAPTFAPSTPRRTLYPFVRSSAPQRSASFPCLVCPDMI